MAKTTVDKILKEIAAGKARPVYLVGGDAVLAEPPAQRLAAALAERAGCEVEVHRRPADLGALIRDLRTFSLFASGKVTLVVDSALFADEKAAALAEQSRRFG